MKPATLFLQPSVLIPALGVVTYVVMQLLGYNGLNSQDSYEYVRYCDAWIQFWQTGVHPGDYYWPMNFPVLGSLLAAPLGLDGETILPLLSLLAVCCSCLMTERMLRWLYPDKSGQLLWVILALFFVPYGFRLGVSSMSDPLAATFCLAAFYFSFRVKFTLNYYNLLGVAFFAGMAFMTRYITAIMLAPLAIYWIYHLFTSRKWGAALLSLPLIAIPFIPHIWIRWYSETNITDYPALAHWDVAHLFMRHFETNLGKFDYKVPNLIYLGELFFFPGFLFFGLLLLPFYRKIFQQKINLLLLIPVALYLLFVGGFDTQNSRYFVTILPFMTLLLYPAFAAGQTWVKQKHALTAKLIFPLLLIGQLGLTGYSMSKSLGASNSFKTLAQAFEQFENETVYCYGTSMILQHFNQQNSFVTLHEVEHNPFKAGDLYLHHVGWEEHPQLQHLYHVKLYGELLERGVLEEVAVLEDGWVLYRCILQPRFNYPRYK